MPTYICECHTVCSHLNTLVSFNHAVPPGSEYPEVEIYIDTTTYLAPEGNPDVPCPVRLSAPYPHPINVCIELVPLDGGTCV